MLNQLRKFKVANSYTIFRIAKTLKYFLLWNKSTTLAAQRSKKNILLYIYL